MSLSTEKSLRKALALAKSGDVDSAEQIYRDILAKFPKNKKAIDGYNRLKAGISPDNVKGSAPSQQQLQEMVALFNRGEFQAVQVKGEAMARLFPKSAPLFNILGASYASTGNPEKAIGSYQRAISADPSLADAHNNLALAKRSVGDLDGAIESSRAALRLKPDFAEAHNNMGLALKDKGEIEAALSCFERAISIAPRFAEAHNNLGLALQDNGQAEEALECFRQAINVRPGYAEAVTNLGSAHQESGDPIAALECFREAIKLNPGFFGGHANLGSALKDIGEIEAALESFRAALDIAPGFAPAISNRNYALNFTNSVSNRDIADIHQKFGTRPGAPARTQTRAPTAITGRRMRIGYVSADFCTHSVSSFFEPMLRAHDKAKFEIFCYYNKFKEDQTTARLKEFSDHWRSIAALGDKAVVEAIQSDEIDILVDLSGHTAGNRLPVFEQKPAPLQMTWLGYPNTTGLDAIDYRIVDDITDPVGDADTYCSEQLLRIPNGFLCYEGDTTAALAPRPPSLSKGFVTFGSFNNIAKITEEVIQAWASILNGVPNSRLLIKSRQLKAERARDYLAERFLTHGIPAKNFDLLGATKSREDHLALYGEIDIALDPFPYNGTTTTCEALWMGVPVVTFCGDRHASRVGASLLSSVGLKDLIAQSKEDYLAVAQALAGDAERLQSLRHELRGRVMNSPLGDAERFARNMEEAYLHAWEERLKNAQAAGSA